MREKSTWMFGFSLFQTAMAFSMPGTHPQYWMVTGPLLVVVDPEELLHPAATAERQARLTNAASALRVVRVEIITVTLLCVGYGGDERGRPRSDGRRLTALSCERGAQQHGAGTEPVLLERGGSARGGAEAVERRVEGDDGVRAGHEVVGVPGTVELLGGPRPGREPEFAMGPDTQAQPIAIEDLQAPQTRPRAVLLRVDIRRLKVADGRAERAEARGVRAVRIALAGPVSVPGERVVAGRDGEAEPYAGPRGLPRPVGGDRRSQRQRRISA